MSDVGSKLTRRGDITAHVILGFATLTALFPVFWTVTTSIKTREDSFSDPPRIVNFDPTSKNYRALLSKQEFTDVLWNTVVVTVCSTLLCVLIGGFAAYALARHRRFPGRRPLEASLVFIRAMPGIVIIVPLYRLIGDLDLYDKRPVMIVIYTAINLPFAIWLMKSFIEQIPIELEECAGVDGASRWTTLRRVVLPLASPGLAATSIFISLLTWNEFIVPALLGGENTKTLPVYISGFISNRSFDWGPLAAASSLAIVPIVILTVAIQRRLVSGLSSGAVKG